MARVELDGRLNVLSEKLEGMRYRTNRYDLLIVAKPDSVFSGEGQGDFGPIPHERGTNACGWWILC